MRKNNQKSLISVHFVCVQAAGSLGCSLAITTSLSIYIQVERLSKLLLHLAYFFQNITSFTGRSYLNSTLFTIALQESLSVYFVFFFKYESNLEFQLQLGYNHIKSDRFTFRSRDFPMTLLHLGYVFQNFMLEYQTP